MQPVKLHCQPKPSCLLPRRSCNPLEVLGHGLGQIEIVLRDVAPIFRALAKSEADMKNFMSAPLFHAVAYLDKNYPGWLAETVATHSPHIIIPADGGEARIRLMRARDLAYKREAKIGLDAFRLINAAQASHDDNPGAVADALFAKHAQAVESGTPIPVDLPQRAVTEEM